MSFSKIFFGVWLAQKNYKMQKSEFGKCRWNPATSGRSCWIPVRKFEQILAVLARSGWNLVAGIRGQQNIGDRMLSDSRAGWILTVDNC
jgi:hypothetical protein